MLGLGLDAHLTGAFSSTVGTDTRTSGGAGPRASAPFRLWRCSWGHTSVRDPQADGCVRDAPGIIVDCHGLSGTSIIPSIWHLVTVELHATCKGASTAFEDLLHGLLGFCAVDRAALSDGASISGSSHG